MLSTEEYIAQRKKEDMIKKIEKNDYVCEECKMDFWEKDALDRLREEELNDPDFDPYTPY
ncbi:hypothetical protein DXT76_10720 [Halobacillus trueperi]|uniref:Uncharacterized protein n=1 Tax=Halobacillus trueperi TaxID=156205 RepID=A0A3D8VN32_9BACI|nr:hypothetical protein [Halobacillus trueperi]RDY70849.1 hypothetical protein DXT76_10720 [Halobacillus trueperi]